MHKKNLQKDGASTRMRHRLLPYELRVDQVTVTYVTLMEILHGEGSIGCKNCDSTSSHSIIIPLWPGNFCI